MAQKKPRISWKIKAIKRTSLEACLHEITVNGWEGGRLKALSWKIIVEKLANEYNFIMNQKQMKNWYNYLKLTFSACLKLKKQNRECL